MFWAGSQENEVLVSQGGLWAGSGCDFLTQRDDTFGAAGEWNGSIPNEPRTCSRLQASSFWRCGQQCQPAAGLDQTGTELHRIGHSIHRAHCHAIEDFTQLFGASAVDLGREAELPPCLL